MKVVATAVRDVQLPGPVPTTHHLNPEAAGPLASEWGLERQVRDLVQALGQAPGPE